MHSSILEKIEQSRKREYLERFRPVEILRELLENLASREQEILRRRFYLDPSKATEKETLENIGQTLKITRERVRQIEKEALSKLRTISKELGDSSPLNIVSELSNSVIEEHGGIMEKEHLVETLRSLANTGKEYDSILLFFLHELLSEKFEYIEEGEHNLPGWKLPFQNLDTFHKVHEILHEIIEREKHLFLLEELLEKVAKTLKEKQIQIAFAESTLIAHLRLAKKIESNVFSEWGLVDWPTVRPRHMNDKIYLILKREGRPLHFKEIAEKINIAGFGHKVAYPATIHNELILDDKYVLVGKGMYALKDWGYTKGTVSEVIEEIFRDKKTPLLKNAIIDEVLKRRFVKKTTIQLALMNKQKFRRIETGEYNLVSSSV